MQGSRNLNDLYEFYRRPELTIHGGPAMVRFLGLVAGILRAKQVHFGTSLTRLVLARVGTGPERQNQPSVSVWSDGRVFYLGYGEGRQDGPFYRSRMENVSCSIEHARTALLELLARLKPAEAEPGAAPDTAI
ncbi:MAG TPA: hypothetical protein VGE74_16985 [Gemmata sp.]